MDSSKPFMIGAGVALWLPLLFSFLGSLSLARMPGVTLTEVFEVLLLITATLLLGLLIGRTATATAE